MRILLDECVPVRLARELPGHQVSTVRHRGWASLRDGDPLQRSARDFDVLLTTDRSLEYQQAMPPQLSLVTVVSRSNHIREIRRLLPAIQATLESIGPGQQVRVGP